MGVSTGDTYLGVNDRFRKRRDTSDDPLASLHLLRDDAGRRQEVMRKANVEGGPDGNCRIAGWQEQCEISLREAARRTVSSSQTLVTKT